MQAARDQKTIEGCLPDIIDMILGWAMDDTFPAAAK